MRHFNNKRPETAFPLYETQWGAPRHNKTPSKVVSIPVHFVGSDRNRIDSATKIQSVARGYLVRKSVKKMMKMKVELEEIEKKVNDEETVKMMKKEQKERIRIGETIMNLLLRLDSVRVFHCSALREFRKSLIKRSIFFQEFVDQIQTMGPTDEVENVEGKCDGFEENCLEKEEENEDGEKWEALVNEGKCVKEDENCLMKVKEGEGEDEDEEKMEVEEKEESVGSSLMEEGIEEENSVDVKKEEEEEDGGNREILRRMMDENEKMMYMMTQLFERNEKQTSLLTSLTQRVEQLERTFTCDKLRKRNKTRRHVDAKHRYNGYI